jgi:hypothetical protein
MQPDPVTKTSPSKEFLAVLFFLFVSSFFALPCLCIPGEIAARFKMALLLLAISRLAWCICKRSFRFSDCLIYFALVVGFCLWADVQYSR